MMMMMMFPQPTGGCGRLARGDRVAIDKRAGGHQRCFMVAKAQVRGERSTPAGRDSVNNVAARLRMVRAMPRGCADWGVVFMFHLAASIRG